MLTHNQIWKGVDLLAARSGLTASGLAKKAGMDPTTFNLSKRTSADGSRPRWPSTESIAKALTATRIGFEEFAALAAGSAQTRSVPLIGLAQAGDAGFFDDAGFPVGQGWEEVTFPGVSDAHAYALQISGDSMAPVYRDGDRVVVAPGETPRKGDRVVVRTTAGEVLAKELVRISGDGIELASLNPDYPGRTLKASDIAWMARIVWASQ
ncbi:S24 family peptidase [Hyphobacterium sp.]|uniref:S24 family peptidase n=1 Tax=Hyphobacterium sp. TaxID=2004662 RepID=UPI003BAB327C